MRSLSVTICSLALAFAAFGQSDRGAITGTVTDPAGAVIAGAPIEAKNTATGAVYPVATTGTGNYTLSELPVGTYAITVSAPGFKKETRTGIEVQSFATFRVDFQLQVGAATESVTITAEAPLLKTESGELAHNVTVDAMDSLPILTIGSDGAGVRNPLAALLLLPGAQFSSDSILRINGLPSSSQSIRIEGQDATNGFWKELNSGNQTGLDAIQEVAIQTSNFSAEFGQVGGGYINYTMKSGTNQFHGSAFDYSANDALNAGMPFTDAGATNSLKDNQLIRNSLRRNDFGGTFGGPIKIPKIYNGTNKTFFFFSYEQYIQKTLTTGTQDTVPTAAYQAGNFSAAELTTQLTYLGVPQVDTLGNKLFGNEIFDPATQQTVNGQVVRSPFPNNTIPASELDATALKIQSLLPQPTNATALVNNYIVPSYYNWTHTELPTLKLDHNVSPTIKLSMFYSANREYSPGNNGFTQVFTGAEPTNTLSQTTRVNYDQSITPRLLMHVGAGLLETSSWNIPQQTYNQSQLFGNNPFYVPYFPVITPGDDTTKGGDTVGLGTGFIELPQKDTKPTFVTSFTWVKGNHTFKFGGEAIFEGLPLLEGYRANGLFTFGQNETGDPYITPLAGSTVGGNTGFAYASFLTGNYSQLQVAGLDDVRLGNHSLGFYAQDSWKISRKLTIDYGLRYDFATLLSEEHGRMQDAAYFLPNTNPVVGGRLGTVVYGGACHCRLNSDYPYALGPRLGIAYKIDDRTVLRIGSGISYGGSPNNAYLSYSVPDFYTYSDQPAAGLPAGAIKNGNPFSPNNTLGNPPLVWPDFTPLYPFQQAPGYAPPESPFISIDRHAGRLPRITQWSVGIQRELIRGLVVEIDDVGNRGAWFTAPELQTTAYNALTPASVQAAGLNPASSSDLGLLTTAIANADGVENTTIAQRFPWLQIAKTPGGFPVIPAVYPGFPATQTLGQALRPYPQWNTGAPPFLGPPLGRTWYDALQLKVTKRFSHGLSANYAFTWQKELALGAASDTSYLVPADPRINDVFNYGQNKQLNPYSRPFVSIISFNYQTPRIPGDSTGLKALSWVTKDWVWGAVLRYQSGALIPTADSNNGFLTELERGSTQNPATWGGGYTYQNLVPGQPLFLVNPNSHFDPTSQLVLNPAAWSDVGAGQFGTAPAFLNNYRWQRQPAESMSFGRLFPLTKERKATLQIRIEFQNVFNRLFYSVPSDTNPSATVLKTNPFYTGGPTGALSSGFGYVSFVNGAGDTPRAGQIVARIQF